MKNKNWWKALAYSYIYVILISIALAFIGEWAGVLVAFGLLPLMYYAGKYRDISNGSGLKDNTVMLWIEAALFAISFLLFCLHLPVTTY